MSKRDYEMQAVLFLHWCDTAPDDAPVPEDRMLAYGYALGAGWIEIDRNDNIVLTTIGQLILDNHPKEVPCSTSTTAKV